MRRVRLFVVESCLQDYQVVVVRLIYKSMLFVYAAGPQARKQVLEWFGFAYAVECVARAVIDEAIDPLDRCLISALPIAVVVPSVWSPDDSHQSVVSECSARSPDVA